MLNKSNRNATQPSFAPPQVHTSVANALLCLDRVCGIAGIAATNGDEIDAHCLASMIAKLAHRGPDGSGMHFEPSNGLAHARLSILDIAGGRQPMSNEDGSIWITFNGEIFNYVELRDELVRKGHRFHTRSDTEVILHLYEDEGADAVRRLNGQWALGIWDVRTRTLFLSRDRVGVRPLFFTRSPRRLVFASEIKALLADPRVSRDLDLRGLDNVFTFWTTLPPRTVFKDVHELPPGHSLIWHDGRCTLMQHWRPTFSEPEDTVRSEDASLQMLASVLTDATRIRLRSDVPVGAYLSGGLDSSVVATLAARAAGRPPQTFSIAFDDPEFDESPHQRSVAEALGSDHHELRISYQDIGAVFPDVVWHAEVPLVRTGPAPLFLLSKFVRELGCRVVLTGEGADEVFGGYHIFKEAKIRRLWATRPSSPRRSALITRLYPFLPNLHRQPPAARQTFLQVRPGDLEHPCFSHLPRWRLTSRLKLFFSDAVRSSLSGYDSCAELTANLPQDRGRWDPLSQSQHLEMAHLLPGYILSSQGDRVAMAHGVEGRYPFLDPHVVDFASTLPPTLKLKVLNEKYLLKRFARTVVPTPVWRRCKQPYRSPDGKSFFARHRPEYVDDLLSCSQVCRDGIFNPEAVRRLVQKFRDGKAIGVKDDMALVGVLSTQIIIDRFINHFQSDSYGNRNCRTAPVHHR